MCVTLGIVNDPEATNRNDELWYHQGIQNSNGFQWRMLFVPDVYIYHVSAKINVWNPVSTYIHLPWMFLLTDILF